MKRKVLRTETGGIFTVMIDGKMEQSTSSLLSAERRLAKLKGPLLRETVLFRTDGATVCHITDDGDGSEPEKLCRTSLIRVCGEGGQEVTGLACEITDLCKQWMPIGAKLK